MSKYNKQPMFSTLGMDADIGSRADFKQTATPEIEVKTEKPLSGGLGSFLGDNIGAVSTFTSVIGELMADREDRKFKKKVYKNEAARADREEKRAAKFRSDFEKGW